MLWPRFMQRHPMRDAAMVAARPDHENIAVLARAMLTGIGQSTPPPIPERAATTGLPFPPEAHPT